MQALPSGAKSKIKRLIKIIPVLKKFIKCGKVKKLPFYLGVIPFFLLPLQAVHLLFYIYIYHLNSSHLLLVHLLNIYNFCVSNFIFYMFSIEPKVQKLLNRHLELGSRASGS